MVANLSMNKYYCNQDNIIWERKSFQLPTLLNVTLFSFLKVLFIEIIILFIIEKNVNVHINRFMK